MKHNNIKLSYSGYKYAPESYRFFCNGKEIKLDSSLKSEIAALILTNRKAASDKLKRYIRAERKKPRIAYKTIAFFDSSNNFYYTQDLRYKPGDLKTGLYCLKEWRRYIKDHNCVLKTGFELSQGAFIPGAKNEAKRTEIESRTIDINHGCIVKLIGSDFNY